MKYKNIMFDLDGTLQDSADGLFAVLFLTLQRMGLPADFDYDTMRKMSGPPIVHSLEHLFHVPADRIDEAMALFLEVAAETRLEDKLNHAFRGVDAMLARLRESGRRLHVVTAKPAERARHQLAWVGLAPYIDELIGPEDDYHADKAAQLNALFDSGRARREESVMVGDRLYDAEAARAAGVAFIGVLYGCGSEEELRAAGAACFAETVPDLEKLLLG